MRRVTRGAGRPARELGTALLFLLPSLILFVAFVFYPLGKTIYLSLFYTTPQGNPRVFAGLDQYTELLGSPVFQAGLVATFWFVVLSVPAGIALALVLATLANRRVRGINAFRTAMVSTIAVSAAVGSLIWLMLFNPSLGLLNYLLSLVGLRGLNWLTEPSVAIVAVSITTIWLGLGFSIIILLAGLQGVPEELYEAAKIDGASPAVTFQRITIPMLTPFLFFLLVVNTIHVFQAFTQIHLLTRGGPVDATRTLVYSIYLDAFHNFQFGYASAQSLVLFAIILVLTVIQFAFVEKRVHYQ